MENPIPLEPVARQDVSTIQEIPDEILTLILAAVRSIRVKDFTTTLRVCRQWHEVGNNLIWRHVVLTRTTLFEFIQNVGKWQNRSHLSQRLRSLTLDIGSEVSGGRNGPDHVRTLVALPQLLPAMSSLNTFSFNNKFNMSNPWSSALTTDEILSNIVKCLPPSVQNLELNSPTIYFKQRTNETCLCDTISARMEGLRSLRLAWPRICLRLLSRPSSTLEYFIINACRPDLRPGIQECRLADKRSSMSWDRLQDQVIWTSKHTVHVFMTKVREPGMMQNLFPRIRKLAVVEPYHFPRHSTYQWFLLNLHSAVANTYDPRQEIQLTTTSYPVWPTGFLTEQDQIVGKFILRRCEHTIPDSRNKDSEHDCSKLDIVGLPSSIWSLLENDAGWKSTESGQRLPRYMVHPPQETLLNEATQNSLQWELFYRDHRTRYLTKYKERHRLFNFDPDEGNFETWPGILQFHRTYHVKAEIVGADYLWYLERKLKHSALWARSFDGGFNDHQCNLQREEFTSIPEEVREVQQDVPFNDSESEGEDEDES